MGLNFALIFSIIVTTSIIFASVYLIVKYMEIMCNRDKEKQVLVVEKYCNNSNNYQKNKSKEIIIDVECEIVKDNILLLGDNNASQRR